MLYNVLITTCACQKIKAEIALTQDNDYGKAGPGQVSVAYDGEDKIKQGLVLCRTSEARAE